MELFTHAIQRGLEAYRNRDKYAYIYGYKGTFLADRQTILNFMAAEPQYFAKYTAEQKEQIIRNSIGKIGYDCSGFVGWHCTGDKRWSTGQIENCSKITSIRDGVAGSLCFCL